MFTEIPTTLIEQIQKGNIVLFLSSGFTQDVQYYKSTQDIANQLANKFLGEEYLDKSIDYIFDLAINNANLYDVQKFIYDIVNKYDTLEHHNLISQFVWKGIITTNIDLLTEKIYDKNKSSLQNLVTFTKNGEKVNEKLSSRNDLMCIKLHGCVNNIRDEKVPLIFLPSQYEEYKSGRSRLFNRLEELAYEYPFLFITNGYSDSITSSILKRIKNNVKERPTSYLLAPNITKEESLLWEKSKIQSIKISFKDFISQINTKIDPQKRKLALNLSSSQDHPIFDKFQSDPSEKKPSQSLMNFLELDVDYIHRNLTSEDTKPEDFYKGYFVNWDPIIKKFDFERNIKDSILSGVFLIDEEERSVLQDFHLIKGVAGSGKSVLLKRLAWDAANEFEKLCLYVKPNAVDINFQAILELYNFCQERIFLFINKASDYIDEIKYVIKKSEKHNIPITIISTERQHSWNTHCKEELGGFLQEDYELKYLNKQEVEILLDLLDKYNSLGNLEDKTPEERTKAFLETADKRLLVALHEVTLGKPFQDIIIDEYNSIIDENARKLYLSVCMLHRLNIYTRAGFISRVHNIPFRYFEEYLFNKLESIVFDKFSTRISDRLYYTRHPHIAEIVFEEVLDTLDKKIDEYERIIHHLDIDFDSDHKAFISMMNARRILEMSKDPKIVRRLYSIAKDTSPQDPQLLQQEAIFEMNSDGGSLNTAESLLKKAGKLDNKNSFIKHSLAELKLKQAENSNKPLIRKKYITDAKAICKDLIKKDTKKKNENYSFHTLLKVNLLELKDSFLNTDKSIIQERIKSFESNLNSAKQYFGDEERILELESRFNDLLNNQPEALKALEDAFTVHKGSNPFIPLRLARYYKNLGKHDKAKEVIVSTLEKNPDNKDLNFEFANLLMKENEGNLRDIKHYLRKSFTKGDSKHENQFWYARCLYLLDDIENANTYFSDLRKVRVSSKVGREPRGIYKSNKDNIYFNGTITTLESSFGFVKRDNQQDKIYFHQSSSPKFWRNLSKGAKVKFNIGFNYRGAIAVNIELINK